MATMAGEIRQLVVKRVRDVQGTAVPPPTALQYISYAQNAVNAALNLIVANGTLQMAPYQGIYQFSSTFIDGVRPLSIRDQDGRDLTKLSDIFQFDYISKTWLRAVGNRPLAWASIGRDMLVLYPAVPQTLNVTVRYTQMTPPVTQDADPMTLPDEYLPAVADLAEVALLITQRNYDPLPSALGRLLTRLKRDLSGPTYLVLERNVQSMTALAKGEVNPQRGPISSPPTR